MGIDIYKTNLVTIGGLGFIPEDLIGKAEMERIEEYMKKHPFPDDSAYSKEDFLGDMETSSPYSISEHVKEETVEYVRRILDYAMYPDFPIS